MELLPYNPSRPGPPVVHWLGRGRDYSWNQALDLLRSPLTECLVSIVRGDEPAACQLAQQAKESGLEVPVILLLDPFRPALAHQLRFLGAYDVLPANTEPEQLNELIAQARQYFRSIHPRPIAASWRRNLIGHCPAMESLVEAIQLIAERRSTITITGETGTGKEIVAQAIHEASGRKGQFVALNCTALPEALMEAELFGHTKGAFTGAQQARAGRFEAADKGTIFLDEIGDMPLEVQAKLLRVLQQREVQRLGSSESIPIDARVIAATNADLLSKVEDGRFREDLYFRLNVVPIHLPPLRERTDDLRLLAHHFVQKICAIEGLPTKKLTQAAILRLEQHHWPGNVRELENTIERAIALSGKREDLLPSDFLLPGELKRIPPASTDISGLEIPEAGIDFEAIIAGIERNMIEQALQRTNGNKSAAADLLRLKRTTLGAKMRILGTPDKIRAISA
jgi:DNA-binding NtrC family response regulator